MFQTTEVEEGSRKVVVSPAAMLKLLQLMSALPVVLTADRQKTPGEPQSPVPLRIDLFFVLKGELERRVNQEYPEQWQYPIEAMHESGTGEDEDQP